MDNWITTLGDASRLILKAYCKTDPVDSSWIEEQVPLWEDTIHRLSSFRRNELRDYLQGYEPKHAETMLRRCAHDIAVIHSINDTVLLNKDNYRPDDYCQTLKQSKEFDRLEQLIFLTQSMTQVFLKVEAESRVFADADNDSREECAEKHDKSCPQGVLWLQVGKGKAFLKKAVQEGYLAEVSNGYRRTAMLSHTQLAYILSELCECDYEDDGKNYGNEFPDKVLCSIFGEKRLGQALNQLYTRKTIQPWREQLDKIFDLR